MTSKPQKSYTTPRVVYYGRLVDLTAGGSPMSNEFVMSMGMDVPNNMFNMRRP